MKLTGSQIVRKFHAFYGTRRFITAFTSARRLSYSSEAFVNGSFHEELLTPRPTPKLKEHPFPSVRHCLFSIFPATLHIGDCSCIRNLNENTIMFTMSADYRFKVDGVTYILVATSRGTSCVHVRALKSVYVH